MPAAAPAAAPLAANTAAPRKVSSQPVEAPPAEAPIAEDNTQFDLSQQREVDANELFDSLFGDAADEPETTSQPEPVARPTATKPAPAVVKPAPTTVKAAPVTAAVPAAANQDEDDDFLIHDDMDLDDETIEDNPYDDYNLRAPDRLARPTPGSSIEIDESLLNISEIDDDALSYEDFEEEEGVVADQEDDEAWARALLDDGTPDDIRSELGLYLDDEPDVFAPVSKPSTATASITALSVATTADTDKPTTSTATATSSKKTGISFELADEQPEDASPFSRQKELAGDIQAAPLTFKQKQQNASRKLWAFGSVLLLVLTASQILYFNFNSWAREPQWRPVYQSICSMVSCQLPSVQNIQQMSTRNLVVRSHPQLANALIVDVLLLNNADYQQPFPGLELSFQDVNENRVASRVFQPAEYLSGEAAGQRNMPSKTPIHIALEIIDPGQNAVSYAINLVKNQ